MRAILLLLLAFVAGCGGCVSAPTRDYLKSTALRLEFEGGVVCSGNMRGPHEVSTAKHCVVEGKLVAVNGKPVEMVGWRQTGVDSVIVSQRGVTFHRWPRTGKAKQGDKIFWWGNPLGVADVYREGYVSGFLGGGIIIDATICKGDSGSGVFNERGELVAIVSAMSNQSGCTFMLASP